MFGFTGSMDLVTVGQGLKSLKSIAESDKPSIGLYRDKSEYKFTAVPVAKSNIVMVLIHNDEDRDDHSKNIMIECTPDQEFILMDGSICPAYKLKGKKMTSIALNEVYCLGVYPHNPELVYQLRKAQFNDHSTAFINGIEVSIRNL
jgi:hypothetical protein